MIPSEQPTGGNRWMWAGAIAVGCLTVAVIAVIIGWRDSSPPAASTAAPAPSASASASTGAGPISAAVACAVGDPACDRQIADLARRAVLTSADQRAGQEAFGPVAQAVTPASAGCTGAACTAAVRHALAEAGYPDAAVHVAAGGDDIAADGSLITAVGVGPACVLVLQSPAGQMSGSVAGRLPDGSCLTA